MERLDDFPFTYGKLEKTADIIKAGDNFRTVITCWALISEWMDAGLKYHLRFGSERQRKELFGPMGPLGTDSAKLRLLLALGWVPGSTVTILDRLRKKRNLLAHSISPSDEIELSEIFNDEKSTTLKSRLSAVENASGEDGSTREKRKEVEGKALLLLLALDVLVSTVCGPSRLELGLGESSAPAFFSFDEGPEWFRESGREFARAYLILLGIEE